MGRPWDIPPTRPAAPRGIDGHSSHARPLVTAVVPVAGVALGNYSFDSPHAATILLAAKRSRSRKKKSLFCASCAFLRLIQISDHQRSSVGSSGVDLWLRRKPRCVYSSSHERSGVFDFEDSPGARKS